MFKNNRLLTSPSDGSEVGLLKAQVQDLTLAVTTLTSAFDELLRLAQETRELVGPFGVPMPNGRMLVQTLHHLKFLIDPNDLIMAPQLIAYRQWEPELSRLFTYNLKPSSVMVDVGANFGYFTCLAASVIGLAGNGQVFSFEPNPKLVPLLRDNCTINWSMAPTQIYDVAVGEKAGSATISVPRNGAANATLTDMSNDCDKHLVNVVSLDDTLPSDLKIDWMKVDVEGHEAGVLKGARAVIERSPELRIVMEWSLAQMSDAGTSADDMINLIEDLGLIAAASPTSGLLADLKPINAGAMRDLSYENLILWRP